jgi:GTP-binding protein
LGIEVLRHIERTRVLVHVVDLAALEGRTPQEAYQRVNAELKAYSPALAQRPQLIAANKMDLAEAHANLPAFRQSVGQPVYPISCATGEGIPELVDAIWNQLHSHDATPTAS